MSLSPQTSTTIIARRTPDWLLCLLLILATVTAKAALTPLNPLNHDVTFLAWTAAHVLGPAVYGRDILDVNPPLAFMLYWPAAFLAPSTGYDPAIRLTVILLSVLSMAAFWHAADRNMRLPLTIDLGLFFVFAFPNHFAQREHFAFLLCARSDQPFDIIEWLSRDEGFRALWQDYGYTRTIANLHLYRRK